MRPDTFSALLQLLSTARVDLEQSDTSVPPLFIVGCPRGGTTAVLQYLAKSNGWCYPSNLLTRFVSDPSLGWLVQSLLFDRRFDPDSTFADLRPDFSFASDLGRTKGTLSPNEFFHFWRKHLKIDDFRALTHEELAEINFEEIAQEIGKIQFLSGKPFLTKAMMCQYNLDTFYNELNQPIVINVKRSIRYQLQSLYSARLHENDDLSVWWSAKPKEYDELKSQSIEHQLAGQLFYTRLAINSASTKLGADLINLEYEEFCANPKSLLQQVEARYAERGQLVTLTEPAVENIASSDLDRLDSALLDKLVNSYYEIETNYRRTN